MSRCLRVTPSRKAEQFSGLDFCRAAANIAATPESPIAHAPRRRDLQQSCGPEKVPAQGTSPALAAEAALQDGHPAASQLHGGSLRAWPDAAAGILLIARRRREQEAAPLCCGVPLGGHRLLAFGGGRPICNSLRVQQQSYATNHRGTTEDPSTFLGGGGPDLEIIKTNTVASRDGWSRAVLQQAECGTAQGSSRASAGHS